MRRAMPSAVPVSTGLDVGSGANGRVGLPVPPDATLVAAYVTLDTGDGPCDAELNLSTDATQTPSLVAVLDNGTIRTPGPSPSDYLSWEGAFENPYDNNVYVQAYVRNDTSSTVHVNLTAWIRPKGA